MIMTVYDSAYQPKPVVVKTKDTNYDIKYQRCNENDWKKKDIFPIMMIIDSLPITESTIEYFA